MIRLARPRAASLERFRADAARRRLNYPEVGGTRSGTSALPAGYVVDSNRVRLGDGDVTWQRAVAALGAWRMFDLGWVEVARPAPEIEPGATVVILVRGLGIACFVQACRIVEVIDEPHRRGFAYGTLEGHYERGEERFQVERDPEGNVHYDILAFSRPGRLLTALGYPLARRMQRRFARDSMAAMARAVRPDPED